MTSKYQKCYPEELKAEAVRRHLEDPSATYSSVAKNLGTTAETLRNWVKRHRQAQGESPAYQAATSENAGLVGYDAMIAEENRKLRAENERLRQERDISRKAAKFFAGETNW